MKRGLSFGRAEETLASKSVWFASLTFSQRMDWLAQFTAMIFQFNPRAAHDKPAQPREGRVLVLERTPGEIRGDRRCRGEAITSTSRELKKRKAR